MSKESTATARVMSAIAALISILSKSETVTYFLEYLAILFARVFITKAIR